MTPEIIAQLQNATQGAADSGSLAMNSDEAMTALRTVSDDFDLNIVAGGSSENQGPGEPSNGSSVNVSPAAVDDYYADNGPPVVTYYSPPTPFVYLHAWVPCPFWFADFYFPGFFILNDFDNKLKQRRSHLQFIYPLCGKMKATSPKGVYSVQQAETAALTLVTL